MDAPRLAPMDQAGLDYTWKDPLTCLMSLQAELNQCFDDYFDRWRPGGAPSASSTRPLVEPRVDVSESDDAVHLTAEVPGIPMEAIEIEVDEDALTLRGWKPSAIRPVGEIRHSREIAAGPFRRLIPLPCRVDIGEVAACLAEGVLTIHLPKPRGPMRASSTQIRIAAPETS